MKTENRPRMAQGKTADTVARVCRFSCFVMRFGCRLGGFALAADGLLDEAVADRLGRHLDAHDATVHDRADLLDVGLELARGDPGGLGPDAAQVLGLAAVGLLVAERGLLTCEIANAGHWATSTVPEK